MTNAKNSRAPTCTKTREKMEKGINSPKRMKSHLCIPRLRVNTTCTIKNHRLSPMTLLERFRQAVFRLMMLSALSKATHNAAGSSPDHQVMKKRSSYYPADPHHSEAVADCIEFIKKSSLTDQEEINRDSTASSSFDDTGEMAMPVPVTWDRFHLICVHPFSSSFFSYRLIGV